MKNRNSITKVIFLLVIMVSILSCNTDPYSEGTHWDYSIKYENGFVYKCFDRGRGTILVLNSDGTPLKVGKSIY